MSTPAPRLVIHGGAGGAVADEEPFHAALGRCASAGWSALTTGACALDAVQSAVTALEDEPLFNGGRGAVLNEHGEAELDAALMDGGRRVGAVAAVSGVRNPVALARAVMDRTPHALLVGPGASAFADREGIERVAPDWHVTDARRAQWRGGDTVGAVALDAHGRLAAGTSTGGIADKLAGRVGDSPIPGAGVYADDAACALSASGDGEALLAAVTCHRVAALVELAEISLDEAVRRVVDAVDGDAGIIAVDPRGEVAASFNTAVFHRAVADHTGVRTAVTQRWR